jgi:hypothetical protein
MIPSDSGRARGSSGGEVPILYDIRQPGIASDRETLVFASNRSPGGSGSLDIRMATRSKARGDGF